MSGYDQGMDTPFDIALGALNIGIWTAAALGKGRLDFAAIAAFFLVGTIVCYLRVSARLQSGQRLDPAVPPSEQAPGEERR